MVCSETVQLLAFFGVIFLYGIAGVVFSLLVSELMKGSGSRQSDKETVVVLAGIFWPVTIFALLGWIIAKVINNLLFGATIFDLRRTEGTLRQEIREVSASCAPCHSLVYGSDGYETQLDIWNVEEPAPIAKPFKVGNHYYWSNFHILNFKEDKRMIIRMTDDELIQDKSTRFDIDLTTFEVSKRLKVKMLNNMVEPKTALHIFNCAFKTVQKELGG